MSLEPWIWVVFIIFLLITTFSVMNVIVAVIVEGTLEQANNHSAEQAKRNQAEQEKAGGRIAEIFCATDTNGDNKITKEEFLESMQSQEVLQFLSEVGIDMRQAENLFEILDYDDSGSLDVEEFSNGILKARGEAQARDVLAVQCELWRYEMKVKMTLRTLCKQVHTDMSKVDTEIELLRLDISKLNAFIPGQEAQTMGLPRTPQSRSRNPRTTPPDTQLGNPRPGEAMRAPSEEPVPLDVTDL